MRTSSLPLMFSLTTSDPVYSINNGLYVEACSPAITDTTRSGRIPYQGFTITIFHPLLLRSSLAIVTPKMKTGLLPPPEKIDPLRAVWDHGFAVAFGARRVSHRPNIKGTSEDQGSALLHLLQRCSAHGSDHSTRYQMNWLAEGGQSRPLIQ